MGRNIVVVPGSFAPWHHGHEFIGNYCRENFNAEVFYEITVNNIDKGLIDQTEVNKRLKAIDDKGWRAITCPYPSFLDKTKYYATIFPSAFYGDWYKLNTGTYDYFYFAIGMDTFARILDTKYTYGSKCILNFQFDQMIQAGVKFLIFDRGDISFADIIANYNREKFDSDIDLLRLFHYLNVKTPNISSTELRSRDVR